MESFCTHTHITTFIALDNGCYIHIHNQPVPMMTIAILPLFSKYLPVLPGNGTQKENFQR
jgi:hypothetical protein